MARLWSRAAASTSNAGVTSSSISLGVSIKAGAFYPIAVDARHTEIITPRALRISYHFADRSSHSPHQRVHQLRAKFSDRTSGQEIVIDRCDFFAEDHAVVA